MDDIIIYIEEIIFKLFGVELPWLREKRMNDANYLQDELDYDRARRNMETSKSLSMFFSKSE